MCGRLPDDLCGQVVSLMHTSVPETKASSLAVADYARPEGAASGVRAYLVAFAPWADDLWMSPPTWRVDNSDDVWSLSPQSDVASLPACFIQLLRQAGLTEYAPTYPAGSCQP